MADDQEKERIKKERQERKEREKLKKQEKKEKKEQEKKEKEEKKLRKKRWKEEGPRTWEEHKLLNKHYWSKSRGLWFVLFLFLGSYDVLTDGLFYWKSKEFLDQVQNGKYESAIHEIDNGTFTRKTVQYAPNCLSVLNYSAHHPPSDGLLSNLVKSDEDDFTCILALRCESVFEETPGFDTSNPNNTYLVPFQSKSFWANVDNATKGNCFFSDLFQQGSVEDLLVQYQRTLIVCLIFVAFSSLLNIVATVQNYRNFYRQNTANFYGFLQYLIEDMSQLCLQIFVFTLQVEIRCWTCLLENGCTSACNGRPSIPQMAPNSIFSVLDNTILETLILLLLSMVIMLLNAMVLVAKGLFNVRHSKWIIPGFIASPFILLGFYTPLTWAMWAALLPLLGLEGTSLMAACLVAAVVGTAVFPIVTGVMIYNFYTWARYEGRTRKKSKKEFEEEIEMKQLPPTTGPSSASVY